MNCFIDLDFEISKKDKYSLYCTINGEEFVMHLYPKPDKLKKTYTITYYVDGELVHTARVREDEEIPYYAYEFDAYRYCQGWRIDDSTLLDISKKTKIRYQCLSEWC